MFRNNVAEFLFLFPMLTLPVELCYAVTRYINHYDYMQLRRSCRSLSRLDSVQYLYFKYYKESTSLVANHPEVHSQIRLDSRSLDDESFVFIAHKGHSVEFVRLFQMNGFVDISTKAKENAFVGIIENGHSHEMICELLKDGVVDAGALRVDINTSEIFYRQSSALHWACVYGYIEIVLLLLQYKNVDVCVEDKHGITPIHIAAIFGHSIGYSF
jgi:hypothetical protein